MKFLHQYSIHTVLMKHAGEVVVCRAGAEECNLSNPMVVQVEQEGDPA